MADVLHGLLHKARLDVERIRYMLREGSDGFQLWIAEDPNEPSKYTYVGRLTSRRFIRAILDDQLSER